MARRKHTLEFKRSAVQLVNQQGYSVPEAAKSLGVDANSTRGWLKKFSDEEGMAPAGEGALAAELRRLRKENADTNHKDLMRLAVTLWHAEKAAAADAADTVAMAT